ncbi:MAG: glycosyltransferase [Candidatus Methanoplasma sp.]|jgi:glycosyltransferase involved in cell wall biosynthesis|nr:glycosyltransferase [Candidatus Methanoplasma sp.]
MSRTGLGKYADNVERCLKKEGAEYDVIYFDIDLSRGRVGLFVNGIIKPLISVLKTGSKDGIFHAADELCGMFFPLIRGKKVLTLHHVIKKGEYKGNLYYVMWMIATAVSIWSADRVIAISEPTKKEILRKFKVDPEKVVCVINGIDEMFQIEEGVEKEKTIGCMGMLIPRKNMSSAVTAFKMLHDRPGMSEYSLEICGNGPEKDKLLRMAETFGISDKVRFVSNLSDSEILRFYNRSALFFNTSLHEGIGLVTIEAQRCGTPVLHLKGADIPEEATRLSVPCANEEEMAESAYELLKNKTEYERIAKRSKEYADTFGNEFCQQYCRVIKELE